MKPHRLEYFDFARSLAIIGVIASNAYTLGKVK